MEKNSNAKCHAYILLVEDNVMNQKVAKIMLEDLGCRIDIAEDAKTALALLDKNTYHLILMDIGLPDMDGLTLTRKIRKMEENKTHIPIITLTAHALEEDRINCFDAGVDKVLTKPIMRNQLIELLHELNHLWET